jgi:hypothetical protein
VGGPGADPSRGSVLDAAADRCGGHACRQELQISDQCGQAGDERAELVGGAVNADALVRPVAEDQADVLGRLALADEGSRSDDLGRGAGV